MQISQQFIAIQKVSLEGYQRLRETLMQQAYLFESVITEGPGEHPLANKPEEKKSKGKEAEEKEAETVTSSASHAGVMTTQLKAQMPTQQALTEQVPIEQAPIEQIKTCFVLMRSPALNVLLVATPLSELQAELEQAELEQAELEQVELGTEQQAAIQADLKANVRSRQQHANTRLSDAEPPALQEKNLNEKALARPLSEQKPNLMQAILSQALLPVATSQNEPPAYQIQLSFDDQTINAFIQQHNIQQHSIQQQGHRTYQETTQSHLFEPNHLSTQTSMKPPPTDSHRGSGERAQSANVNANTNDRQANQHPADERNIDNRVVLNHEDFVLAWAKQLADSPEGMLQATLANQVQQSLLLNQVITRIRHSLDLPAILETTVAQVREFLSADRLVVYQFEQIKSVDLSSPSSTEPFSQEADKSDDPKATPNKATSNGPTTDIAQNSNTIIGRCTHDGHVTYESRISEDIPSVLNLSESECFMPSLPIRDRYIMGNPIAVDDIDRKYAHADCLLDFLHQAQVKSKIIAPIIVQDQLWGLLIAHQCNDYRHWQETEILFLQHIAEHLAVAIGQASLYHQLQEQTTSLESCVVERTQNLHDALLAAESANLTKGEFLSTMSHELRTPLTYIIGMSATLLRWSFGELSERQRSYLNTINHSGEQLLDIINDILEFAKISSGRSFLEISEFSLSSLIEEIMEHFQPIAERRDVNLSLSLKIDSQQDKFVADARRLQQILSNLIHNAIKFTPAGGQVTLNVWREKNGREDNNGREKDIGVFQVEDTGIGIPEAQQDLLFEKFKQLESPFKRQYAGTGLGLAMTKRLVELHGGTIQVQSAVDEGSVFSVRLPIQTPESSDQRYQVPSTLLGGANRILLIEEQENSAAIICDLLTADGYEVIWEVNADQILNQLASLKPAMLIADLALLSHDAENIKDIQLTITDLNTKVLALLAQSVSESSHIAHHDTLSKPIDPKKLLEKVRHLTLTRQ